jgi:hypothetical protein
VWQYTAIDVASAYTWATLQVTRRNPSAVWTSALARQVAADLPALAALTRAHDALLYVGDAHGFGVIGERDGYEPSPFGRSGNAIVRFFGESYDQVVLTAGSPRRTRRCWPSSPARPR